MTGLSLLKEPISQASTPSTTVAIPDIWASLNDIKQGDSRAPFVDAKSILGAVHPRQ